MSREVCEYVWFVTVEWDDCQQTKDLINCKVVPFMSAEKALEYFHNIGSDYSYWKNAERPDGVYLYKAPLGDYCKDGWSDADKVYAGTYELAEKMKFYEECE